MNDANDKPDRPAETPRAGCTESGMRTMLLNLEEFALMMSRRSSIRALEILEVVPPERDKPPLPRPNTRPAVILPHPAVTKKTD